MFFSKKEKREHFRGVAKGTIPVKKDSKFSEKEQRSYARGQADARNEAARAAAYRNATPEQRAAYTEKRRVERAAYLASKKK